jgi:hypothetical protein
MLPIVGDVLKPGDTFEWSMSYRFSGLLKKEFMSGSAQYLPNGTNVFVSGKPMDMRVIGFLALSGQYGERDVLAVTQSKLWDVSMNSRNVSKSAMRLYPNPTNGSAMLETDMTGDKQVLMLSSAGQVVAEFSTRESNLMIPTTSLADGIYYLKCMGADGVKQVSFIVRH